MGASPTWTLLTAQAFSSLSVEYTCWLESRYQPYRRLSVPSGRFGPGKRVPASVSAACFTKHHKKGYDVFVNALLPAVLTPSSLSTQAENDAQLIQLWLHGRTANTQAAYQHDIGKFFSFAGKPIRETTLRDFQNFADAIEGSIGTKRRVIAAIKS